MVYLNKSYNTEQQYRQRTLVACILMDCCGDGDEIVIIVTLDIWTAVIWMEARLDTQRIHPTI